MFVNYEVEYIPQMANQTNTILTEAARQGTFQYVTAAGVARSVNVYQLAGAAGFQSTPDPTMAAVLAQAGIGPCIRQHRAGQQPPHRDPDVARAAEDRSTTTRRSGSTTRSSPNLSFMTSYNRYNQDSQGRRVWPIPGFPINSGTFDSGWWVWSTGTNWTIGSNMHNELRFGIQHSGDTNEVGRQAEFFELNGIVNGKAAQIRPPARLAARGRQRAGHRQALHHDHHGHADDGEGDHTFKFGGNFRDTQWRDRALQGSGTGGYLGLPRYSLGIATGDPVVNAFTAATMPERPTQT